MAAIVPEDLVMTPYHKHVLRLEKTLGDFKCQGCKEMGETIGYSCPKCRDFKLHELCADHADEVHHPLEGQHKKLTFRRETTWPGFRRCDVCKETIWGFVFSSERCKNKFRAHPLCIDLPPDGYFSCHNNSHEDHLMKLRDQKNEFNCSVCNEKKQGWRYKCEKSDCKEEIEVRCIMKELHFPVTPTSRSKRAMVWKGFKFLGKCVMSAAPVAISLLGGNAFEGNPVFVN